MGKTPDLKRSRFSFGFNLALTCLQNEMGPFLNFSKVSAGLLEVYDFLSLHAGTLSLCL
jgi:hypothetical protein